MRIRVNLDKDGVLGDFSGLCQTLFGFLPGTVSEQVLWDTIEEHVVGKGRPFWTEIPLMPRAHEIMDIARPYGVRILTGCPKRETLYDIACRDKREWGATNFPGVSVATCLARQKAAYMEEQGDILVDDFFSNCRRWSKEGGYAVQYHKPDQAVTDLRTALAKQFGDL